jgi:ADP-ribose pyrophosphatase YjhB (NUDIX family)
VTAHGYFSYLPNQMLAGLAQIKELFMSNYEDSYIGRIRKLAGKEKLIIVATRAVIRDRENHILFVRRSDNSKWVMPSGALELDETLFDGMKREVKEETGLDVITATPMAIYSYPSSLSAYGDAYYQISIQFMVKEWSGTLLSKTDETTQAHFFDIDRPPEGIASHYKEVLEDLRTYDGEFILK